MNNAQSVCLFTAKQAHEWTPKILSIYQNQFLFYNQVLAETTFSNLEWSYKKIVYLRKKFWLIIGSLVQKGILQVPSIHRGRNKVGPWANCPQHLVRAQKMLRLCKGPNGTLKCWLISIPDVYKCIRKTKSGPKKLRALNFLIPRTQTALAILGLFWPCSFFNKVHPRKSKGGICYSSHLAVTYGGELLYLLIFS